MKVLWSPLQVALLAFAFIVVVGTVMAIAMSLSTVRAPGEPFAAGTAAGAVAGAVVGSFFAKGLGGGNVARTLTGVGGGAGGAALGQRMACK